MINVNSNGQSLSADFVSALTAENRTYDGRLLMNGSVLDCSVNSITVTKGSCGSDTAFTIGNVVGSTLVADVEDLQVSVKGQEIEAQIGIEINGAFEYVTLGKFVVSEAPQNVYKTTITAYGATITRTGAGFTVPSTKTLANIASSIASSMSALAGRTITVTFDSGITTSKTITADMSNLTVYQALQILASVVGGYAIDTYDGNVKICRFSDTPTLSRTVDTMLDLPIVEEPFEISGVLCVVSTDTQYPATPTGNENLIIRNQYVTQDLYDSYLATLTGYEYRPADIGLTYGDPRLEGNDVVQITDIDESVYIIPCHMLTHVYAGGFSTQVRSSQATEQANDVATSAGSLTEQISTIGANAISARASAESARQSAESAEQSATTAYNLASQVEGLAQQANQNAQSAQQSASQALTQAQSASASATSALRGLSTVEDVVDTLNWITAHGTMESQAGKTFDANKVYFIVDQNGDYVVQNVHYSIVANPQASQIANYYCLSVDESIQNYVVTHIAVDNEGLWIIPDAGGNKVLIATGNGTAYTTAGTYIIGKVNGADAILAEFSANGVFLGETGANKSRSIINADGLQVYHVTSGGIDRQVVNLGYGLGVADETGLTSYDPFMTLGSRAFTNNVYSNTSTYTVGTLVNYDGKTYICKTAITTPENWDSSKWQYYIGNYSVAEGLSCTASGAYSHAEGFFSRTIGRFAHAEGDTCKAFGSASHAEGSETTASGMGSHSEGVDTTASSSGAHAEGYQTTASDGWTHAEGYKTTASGITSHAEGNETTASGEASHSEGNETIASGDYSHAEGRFTEAIGDYSHAEGRACEAHGDYSHAEGDHTVAVGDCSHVMGKYNNEDTNNTYAFIVGNGESANQTSNAFSVGWDGSITLANHSSPVGWYDVNGGSLNKVTGTSFTAITASAITLTAGRWLVLASARYSGATSGNRGVAIYKSNSIIDESEVISPAIPSASWSTCLTTSAYISTSSSITVNIGLLQNSGSSLTTNWKLTYIRIR